MSTKFHLKQCFVLSFFVFCSFFLNQTQIWNVSSTMDWEMNSDWLSSGKMQLRYQFCLNQYFYKFIMLIFCCQLLCPVHLGYHIFTYGLLISLRMNRVTPAPLSTYRSHECQFWFWWIVLFFNHSYLFLWQPEEQSVFCWCFFLFPHRFIRCAYQLVFYPGRCCINQKYCQLKSTHQTESSYGLSTAVCLQKSKANTYLEVMYLFI